jgi:phosphomannomutase
MKKKFPSHIFKAYDIRGVYPSELDEDLAYKIGRAFVVLLKMDHKLNYRLKIVVSSDMRISSPKLKKSLIKGIIDQGADVIDIGLASSPTFYFAVAYYGYDGGVIVSASHNPKEYNGFKFVRRKAKAVSKETGIYTIRDLVDKNDFLDYEKGSISQRKNVLDDQLKHDINYANIESIKKFKIVLDPANAMGIQYLDAVFSKIDADIIKMNFELDGNFPAHQADPLQEKNVIDLKKRVLKEKADLGITTDGDGDRIFFVDDKGEIIPPHILRALLAKIFLRDKPGSNICYDIRPGKITKDVILENGGKPVITRVGHSLIKEKMIEVDAFFAGESSGHFFLRFDEGYYEAPIVVILKMLEELSKYNVRLSDLIKPYKKYFHSGEINSSVENKEEIMKKLALVFSDANEINYLDGLTVEYDDFWFNVRPSNTESLLRLNLEAKTRNKMIEMRDKVLSIIRE